MLSCGEMAKKKKAGQRDDSGPVETAQPAKQPQSAEKMPPKARPKSEAERKKDRIDGIKKTVYPSVLGVVAGFACYYGAGMVSENPWSFGQNVPWHFVALVVILITYFVQKITYPFMNIEVTRFGAKDWFYVEFMAVDLWLVTWTLLLN
jgi:hypothetical protein